MEICQELSMPVWPCSSAYLRKLVPKWKSQFLTMQSRVKRYLRKGQCYSLTPATAPAVCGNRAVISSNICPSHEKHFTHNCVYASKNHTKFELNWIKTYWETQLEVLRIQYSTDPDTWSRIFQLVWHCKALQMLSSHNV